MEQQIADWVSENLLDWADRSEVGPDTRLLDEVGLDSLQVVELVGFLEIEFDIAVPGESLTPENFESVRSICRMVDDLKSRPAG